MTEYSTEPPFLFDPAAEAKRHAREMDLHFDDLTMPWPRERLHDAAREIKSDLDQLPDGSWPLIVVRVADVRATFDHIAALERQLSEARTLAETLYAFECRGADWPNTLEEFNADLEHELLPKWLTGEPDAPETWQTPHANEDAAREAGMDATHEHDPDLGKDLDYDDEGPDEDERTTDADYETYDGTDDEYEMDHDENGWPK